MPRWFSSLTRSPYQGLHQLAPLSVEQLVELVQAQVGLLDAAVGFFLALRYLAQNVPDLLRRRRIPVSVLVRHTQLDRPILLTVERLGKWQGCRALPSHRTALQHRCPHVVNPARQGGQSGRVRVDSTLAVLSPVLPDRLRH